MNIVKNMLYSLVALVLMTNVAYSDGADSHQGIYVGAYTQFTGVELDGNETGQNDTTTGAVGKYAVIAGGELGYNWQLGDGFLIGLGYDFMPGEAKVSNRTTGSDSTHSNTSAAISFEVSDMATMYIAPTIAVSDTSAIYLKYGKTDADTKVVGDVTKPTSMDGTTFAIGSTTQFASGFYFKTEAGYVDFDQVKVTGLGTSDGAGGTIVPTTTSVTVDPTLAYGRIALGYKF
jgi:hypothetical protein